MEITNPAKPLYYLNLNPQEQVFSNHLVLNEIFKYLGTHDLLQMASVSVNMRKNSRKYLKMNTRNHPLCVQISEPLCRQLAEFNAFLDETYSSPSNNDQLAFNGIQYHFVLTKEKIDSPTGRVDPKCVNCMVYEWRANVNDSGMTNDKFQEIITKNMLATYQRILEKMTFKFVRFQGSLPHSFCPFSRLLKFVLKERPHDVLELDFGTRGCPGHLCWHFLRQCNLALVPIFPNLEVLGLDSMRWIDGKSALPVVAPLIKKINHFSYSTSRQTALSEDFPGHAITNLECFPAHPEAVIAALEFVIQFQPKITTLNIMPVDPFMSDELKTNLFQLGRLTAQTLTYLLCSVPYFINMAAKFSKNRSIQRNYFPSMTNLTLIGLLGTDFIKGLNMVGFSENFPRVRKIVNLFYPANPQIGAEVVSGPSSRINTNCLKKVPHLQIRPLRRNFVVTGFMTTVLSLFAHVRHLNLTRISLTCGVHDQVFGEVMREIQYLLSLEEITVNISADAMRDLCLDHLFLENNSTVGQEAMTGTNKKVLRPYTSSVLNHKSLKQINITGPHICTKRGVDNNLECWCYSIPDPGAFLVTCAGADIICKLRPGFKFHVTVLYTAFPVSNNGEHFGNILLEHLKPYGKIAVDSRLNRTWKVEFLQQEQ